MAAYAAWANATLEAVNETILAHRSDAEKLGAERDEALKASKTELAASIATVVESLDSHKAEAKEARSSRPQGSWGESARRCPASQPMHMLTWASRAQGLRGLDTLGGCAMCGGET